MERQKLNTEQKALEINLDDKVYGTFAEIGAGQEVARHFFQVGGAAGTIAKTMSAYDKTYSDAIYGVEESRRYVCESRVYKMLDHEYELMEERLHRERPNVNFFVFADTVAAINYKKTVKGYGWMGLRFQLSPLSEPNDIVIHAHMLDNNNKLQQEAIGVLGVNLLYACYFYHDDPEVLVQSLMDNLRGRMVIDLIRLTGPDFEHVDNRLLTLYLVKHGLTEVSIFNSNGKSIHASEFLYRKTIMVVRGHFRPPTLVTVDAFESSFRQFMKDNKLNWNESAILAEITLDNLRRFGDLNERDFLDRSEMLCALGHNVIISDCSNHQRLINYMKEYKIQRMGLVIGANELLEIINEKYYQNMDGRLLTAFGELFTRNIKIYTYPALRESTNELLTAHNLPVPDGIKFLYKHLLDSEQVVEVEECNQELLHIYPSDVYEAISQDDNKWEKALPPKLVELIKEKELFNYSPRRMKVNH